jgi:antirestriction protein
MSDTPRIYVACLASYNAGILHGEWIDVTDADSIHEAIQEMLKRSPSPGAEEWAIHDYDGFGPLGLSEYEDIGRVAELGALIAEHGEAFAAYADHVGAEYATEDGFQDAYCGEWDSEQAYAENLFDELYAHEVPEHIAPYIDYEAFTRDLFISDYFSVDRASGVHVFRNG